MWVAIKWIALSSTSSNEFRYVRAQVQACLSSSTGKLSKPIANHEWRSRSLPHSMPLACVWLQGGECLCHLGLAVGFDSSLAVELRRVWTFVRTLLSLSLSTRQIGLFPMMSFHTSTLLQNKWKCWIQKVIFSVMRVQCLIKQDFFFITFLFFCSCPPNLVLLNEDCCSCCSVNT